MKAITDATFDKELGRAHAILKFTAHWCKPCIILQHTIDRVEARYPGFKFLACDVDVNASLVSRFSIQQVPTLILFKKGKPVHELHGVVSEMQLEQAITTYILN